MASLDRWVRERGQTINAYRAMPAHRWGHLLLGNGGKVLMVAAIPEELALNCVLRTSEAAQFGRVSVSHFRRLYSRGQLPASIRLGEGRLGWRLGDPISLLRSQQMPSVQVPFGARPQGG
jgi:predicted DNA-binding transcriptional regulator AlpA